MAERKKHPGPLSQPTLPFTEEKKTHQRPEEERGHSQTVRGRVCSFIHSFIPWMNTDARGTQKSGSGWNFRSPRELN